MQRSYWNQFVVFQLYPVMKSMPFQLLSQNQILGACFVDEGINEEYWLSSCKNAVVLMFKRALRPCGLFMSSPI